MTQCHSDDTRDPYTIRLATSGLLFNPWQPNLDLVTGTDIAIGLGNLCRFGGQICDVDAYQPLFSSVKARFYSVAQHCVVGLDLIPADETRLRVLWVLHDAPEALGFVDVPRPVKRHPGMQAYREAEERLMYAVWREIGGITPNVAEVDAVKAIDDQMLQFEQAHLFGSGDDVELWEPAYAARKLQRSIGQAILANQGRTS